MQQTKRFAKGVSFYATSLCLYLLIFKSRATRLYTPLCRSVGRLVGRLVGWSLFYFFGVFELFEHTAPAQMP